MSAVTRTITGLLSAAMLLSGCLLGGEETRYRLIAPQVDTVPTGPTAMIDASLAIARPGADRTRDSSRILVRRDRTLLPWAGAAWIDRSPDLVQDLLADFLTARMAAVGRYGSLPADHRLDLVLRRFEFVEDDEGLQAEIVLVGRLFDVRGELLGATTLSARERSGKSIEEAVRAMETAMEAVFGELAGWLRPRLSSASAAGRVDQ